MKRTGLLMLWALVLGSGLAVAEDEPPEVLTPEQAADAVLAAYQAEDLDALKALAEKDEPDPWLVADELCFRGEHDAGEAFAGAAPRADTDALPAYVGGRRGRLGDPAGRERLRQCQVAFEKGNFEEALRTLNAGETEELRDVVSIMTALACGFALANLARWQESHASLREAAAAAERLGWLARASMAEWRAGLAAYRGAAYEAAEEAWKHRVALCERRGDRSGAAAALGDLGLLHYARGDYEAALSVYERALTAQQALGDEGGAAAILCNMASVHQFRGDYPLAMALLQKAIPALEGAGHRTGVAAALGNLGNLHDSMGNYAEALSLLTRAHAAHKALGNETEAAQSLGNMGLVHLALGDMAEALSILERVLSIQWGLGDRAGAACTLGSMGGVHLARGDYVRALSTYERVLSLQQELGEKGSAAITLGNIGHVHVLMGNYAQAFLLIETALAAHEALGNKASAALAMVNLGFLHQSLGNDAKALSLFERALAVQEMLGAKASAALTLGNIGVALYGLGDVTKALACHERALVQKEAIGDSAGAAHTLRNIGDCYYSQGDYPGALSAYERALALYETLGDKAEAVWTLGNMGIVHDALGDLQQSTAHLGRAVRHARRLRLREAEARFRAAWAKGLLRIGDAPRSLSVAQPGLVLLEDLLGGLAEEEGAMARAEHASLFAVGALAAARTGEPIEAVDFLESGRAGSLMESLGGQQATRWGDLPENLREAEAEAEAAESRARYEYGRALDGGKLREIRKAAKALDEATDQIREISARIQREAKKQAGLLYPRAATMEEIEGWLEKDEALVLYGLCLDEALALVLTQDSEHSVSLGTVDDVHTACESLQTHDKDTDPTEPLQRLHALLIEPLNLPEAIKTVLVSPEGPLCYVPFGALFDRPVLMTPSGTTHVLLMEEEREPGEKVLAIGDPDYGQERDRGADEIYRRGGSALVSLPGTRIEAETIGDVTLLGSDASEEAFVEAVAKEKRWRAVHLACHGLVDPERPTLSSLALTRAGEEDGFLTALEVLRMEIPADLVVLSACETGKGKIVRGEGIVGLTRVFMYAGAPRVICSLWKVDDEATRALMVKFYELWNPDEGKGLGAAAALKKAQEFVKSHEKWKHPYYWAAWVLWGLPQ